MAADFTVELVDPLGQIVRECAYKPRPSRASIALTYAFALRQDDGSFVGYGSANLAIVRAYGKGGLAAIKAMAWGIIEGTHDPATGKRKGGANAR